MLTKMLRVRFVLLALFYLCEMRLVSPQQQQQQPHSTSIPNELQQQQEEVPELAKPRLACSWQADAAPSEFRVATACYRGVLRRCKCAFLDNSSVYWTVHKQVCVQAGGQPAPGGLKSPHFTELEHDVEPGYTLLSTHAAGSGCTTHLVYAWSEWEAWSADTLDDDCGPDLWETRTRRCLEMTQSEFLKSGRILRGCSLTYYTDQGLIQPYKLVRDGISRASQTGSGSVDSAYEEQDTCYFEVSCDSPLPLRNTNLTANLSKKSDDHYIVIVGIVSGTLVGLILFFVIGAFLGIYLRKKCVKVNGTAPERSQRAAEHDFKVAFEVDANSEMSETNASAHTTITNYDSSRHHS